MADGTGTKRSERSFEVSPLFMLMIMEDYEAMNGDLVNNPAYQEQYKRNKQALIRIK